MEVDRLVEIGVLKWAAPSFIIPKKDGTTRFINDFRELNKTSEMAILRFGTKGVGSDAPPVQVGQDSWIRGANYQFNYGGTW
jgi:hypothetical protein